MTRGQTFKRTFEPFYSHYERFRKPLDDMVALKCRRCWRYTISQLIASTMLLTITLKHDIVATISAIFIAFFDYNYGLRRLKTSHRRPSSVFSALGHRFLRGRNNVTSVFYILNKAISSIKLIIFNITRLGLACLNRGICFYINVFFLCIYFLLT